MYWSCSGTRCMFKTMRCLVDLTLLLSVLSIVKAFPATKNGPPIEIIDEDTDDSLGPVPNVPASLKQDDGPHQKHDPPMAIIDEDDVEDSLGPVPNVPTFLKQDDGPHQKHALLMDEKDEEDDIVISKRRPYVDSKWPKSNGIVQVPYTASGVNNAVLKRAIEVFNAKTCIRFVPRESQSNYVQFQSGSSCGTIVGYQGDGIQELDLTSGCAAKKGKVMHEMMHAIGFLHEQCRPDRDSYVTVHTDRIKTAALPNFQIESESVDQGISYDCDSILHYRSAAFAIVSGQETITSLDPDNCPKLGNDDTRLSIKDYKRVNTFYSCGKPEYEYYTVQVITDPSSFTGTDCYIYLTLHGSSQTSTEFELDLSTDSSADLFESGSDDTFKYMAYRNDLGSITGISVRMVSNGNGEGWWPTSFSVTYPAGSSPVTFTNNQWLYPSSTYGTSSFPLSRK